MTRTEEMKHNMGGLQLALGILGCMVLEGVASVRPQHYGVEIRQSFFQHHHPQRRLDNLRSIELDTLKMAVPPTSGQVSLPTILKLSPNVGKAMPLHANLPLRFGREPGSLRVVKSSLNLPQRFGRSQGEAPRGTPCLQCPRSGALASPSATMPQRFGRRDQEYPSVFLSSAETSAQDEVAGSSEEAL